MSEATEKTAHSADDKAVHFEESLRELENLVRQLEQGELSLEQSLKAFERGVSLTRLCQQALKSAEQRVQVMMQASDGSLQSQPLNTVQSPALDAAEKDQDA